ncbi:phospholipid-binding protein MlaC [Pelagibius sp. Alg239-R121]|uniref:MlaC/ttg2D family ABC transporter substrate-binding protein n=1 Tax=Pelagibius sp. Alg239-R121 TaxID=2993448 RepID=UPI0024A77131|nr:ABC transporter substrate-binding protein [Pelagibius sp. Alg239-R121]
MLLSKRQLLSVLAATTLLAQALLPVHSASAAGDAAAFVVALKDDAVKQLSEANGDEALKEQRFRKLLNNNFEVEDIGKFVIGRYWRKASAADRDEFLKVFEDVLVQRFLPLFDDYVDRSFSVDSVRADAKRPEFSTVVSRVSQPKGADAQVLWRVRESGGKFQISDVKAEGISLRITYQSEYSSFLKNNSGNVSKLSKLLRRKIKAGAFAPK